MIPFVIERTANSERSYDLFSRLLKDRIVFINGEIRTEMAHIIVAQLLFLENEDNTAPIYLYVNSVGGEVTAGLAIYDTMNFIKSPVHTFVIGQAASMGSLLAQAGEPGHRYIMPHARHMIHQVSSGTQGTAIDMKIALAETLRLNRELTNIYVKHNSRGKTLDDLEADMSRDFFMTSTEAVEYGLADKVIATRSDFNG